MTDMVIGNQTQLARAEAALRKAQERYEAAELRSREASKDETAALNALNDAQKAFDKLVEELRQSAPRRTDWKQDRRETVRGESVGG